MGQLRQPYFKVEQVLFQSGSKTVISKWVNAYFKMGQNVVSKWGITLSCSRSLLSFTTLQHKFYTFLILMFSRELKILNYEKFEALTG